MLAWQVICTGLLEQGSSAELLTAWEAAFNAAVSAVYLAMQLKIHDAMFEALSESTQMMPRTEQTANSAAARASSSISMLAQSQLQPATDQPPGTESVSIQAQQPVHASKSKQPFRTVKAAWPELPKRNSVSPLPVQEPELTGQSAPDKPPDSTTALPQVSAAHQSLPQPPIPAVMPHAR